MSIIQERLGDALDAEEEFLLVPAPVGATQGFNEGFLGQVVKAFPAVAERIREKGGVRCGELYLVGHSGQRVGGWLPAYTLALAGIHYREPNGWNESPDMLRAVMDKIQSEAPRNSVKLATAGIPGTGNSGLRGNASNGVQEVLMRHSLPVVVYRQGFEGQGARMLEAVPPQQAREEAFVPKAYAVRHPEFSHTL
jgi:hypothetical protein